MPADQNPPPSHRRRGDFGHDIAQMSPGGDRHPHCIALRWHMRSVPRSPRSILSYAVATLVLLASSRALGQGTGGTITTGTGGVTGTSALAATDFTILFEEYNGQNWVQMNTTTQQYFFNQARCLCDQDPKGEFRVVVQPGTGAGQKIQTLLEAGLTGGQGVGYLFASTQGYDCLAPNSVLGGIGLGTVCTNLLDPDNYPGRLFTTMGAFGTVNFVESDPIPVAYLFNSLSNPTCGSNGTCDSGARCSTTNTQTKIQFWAQTNSGISPDFDPGPPAPVNLVGYVPVTPTDVTAAGGNNALTVSWSWGDVNIATDTTLSGVQIFCQVSGDDNPVFTAGSFGDPAYDTPATVCPNNPPAATATTGPFSNLDPKYLCSGLIPSNTKSYRIKNLLNGTSYVVGVAAVDRYRNIGAISNLVEQAPVPTVDFYSEYKNAGGSAQGGFCALAGRNAKGGLATILGFAALGLILRLRRRSKRRATGKGALVLLIAAGILTAGQARAQTIYHDDFIVQDQPDEVWNGTPREFAIEARFGLYTPDIDSEFSGSGTKPQSFIFGSKKRPMWQIEFDWEFLQAFGTLSLGGVIGYYKENANACFLADLQATGDCVPSGDNTGLRLIPLAALLVYRMDEGANHWKIPFVPYAKIGLNYTIWTVTNGDGNVATTPGGGRGQGGTMGWQAAAGLSLQLDFLDPGAARGFDADAGVNHTYAFFELDHIDGSGLYRKDVLRVGDNTWFAGLMFEF